MLSRLLGIDDRILLREYEEFAQEKASLFTAFPVYLKIVDDNSIPKIREGTRPGGTIGWCLTTRFGEDAMIEFYHVVKITKWVWRLLKHNPVALRKIICHELAHLKYPDPDHGEDFASFAAGLGAGECTGPSFDLGCWINQPRVALIKPILDHLPMHYQERILLSLGGKFDFTPR